MDASNVVNAFVASANQYAQSQNEDSVKQFQRHLEILVCLTCEESNLAFFKDRSLMSSQCITHVVNVLLDNNAKQPLISRALSILHNLSTNTYLMKSLQSTFHIHSAISIFLQRYGINTKDSLVMQCLQILESVTYNITIEYLESHFENFINTLLKFVLSESSNVLKSSIHILSNICRQNSKVQIYICSLPNIRQIFKKFATIINTEVPNIILYALSILSSITPYNNFGTKLWTDEHLLLTFDLVMKLLICDDYNCATTALDLFSDLLKTQKYHSCLLKSSTLYRCLRKIHKALYEAPPKHCIVYLKFIQSLTAITEISEKLCSTLCVAEDGQLRIHPNLTLWCTERNELELTVITLQLIRHILTLDNKVQFPEESVKNILSLIMKDVYNTNDYTLEEYLQVKRVGFDLLLFLITKTHLKNFIYHNIIHKDFETLIKFLFSNCSAESNCYDRIVDVFLLIIETLSFLGTDCEAYINTMLQSEDALQCLAFALTSDDKDLIHKSLSLLARSRFSCSILGESLYRRSLQKNKSAAFLPALPTSNSVARKNESSIDFLMNKIENGLQIKDLKTSEIMDLYEHKIAMMTLKEQELQNYVEAKTIALQEADRIITQYKCHQADGDVETLRLRSMMKDYECRCEISSTQLNLEEQKRRRLESDVSQAYQKIKELEQNVNEQRELSQTQVNRFLEQRKTMDEEKTRLCEQITVKDQEKKLLITQLQQNEEELRLRNKALEDLHESKEELKKILEETKKAAEKFKMNSEQRQLQLQTTIDAAQQMVSSLEEKNENLTKDIANKSAEFVHRITDLTGQNEQLMEQLKLKDLKIEDMGETLRVANDNLHKRNCTIQENQSLLSTLNITLEQIESQRSKLKQDKGILELLCKKYEASIEEKDSEIQSVSLELDALHKEFDKSVTEKEAQIKHLKGELEKHKCITEMIHNMTSGRTQISN